MTTREKLEEQMNEHILAIEGKFQSEQTFGGRVADKIASFGGSWKFIGWMLFILFIWILFNTLTLFHFIAFDPFPFILLNLCLSFLAGFQAPIIMMSQNRQSLKESYYAQENFRNNYIVYLEMQELNGRLDRLDKMFDEVDDIAEIAEELSEHSEN